MHPGSDSNQASSPPPTGGPRVFFAQGFPSGFARGIPSGGGPFGASQRVWQRVRSPRADRNPLQRLGDTLLKACLLVVLLILGAIGLVFFVLLAVGVLVFLGMRSAWRSLLAGARGPRSGGRGGGGRENVRVITRR